MTGKTRLLIVDDEAPLRKALRLTLTAQGFEVDEVSSGEAALENVRERKVDLVLLDINMGGISGIDVCRRMREMRLTAGIVMVTVCDSEREIVASLDAGADDYVTKPFQVRELLARVDAVLRRIRAADQPGEPVLQAGELMIDFERRIVRKSKTEIRLSQKEFQVLEFLARSRGVTVRHTEILDAVWGPGCSGDIESLRAYIRMLRVKIEDQPERPKYILTEPWAGYRFQIPAVPRTEGPT